jgi:hypothetical protein
MGQRGHFSLLIAAPLGPIAATVKGRLYLQVLAQDVLQTLRLRSFGSPKGGDPQDDKRFPMAVYPAKRLWRLASFYRVFHRARSGLH